MSNLDFVRALDFVSRQPYAPAAGSAVVMPPGPIAAVFPGDGMDVHVPQRGGG
jgi:hypothetical protein